MVFSDQPLLLFVISAFRHHVLACCDSGLGASDEAAGFPVTHPSGSLYATYSSRKDSTGFDVALSYYAKLINLF